MISDPSNYDRGYSPNGSCSLFQYEKSDVTSVLKDWSTVLCSLSVFFFGLRSYVQFFYYFI